MCRIHISLFFPNCFKSTAGYAHSVSFWPDRNRTQVEYKYDSLSVGHPESRRMTDELGSRQRDLSTSSVTKRANGHWHAIIASSCR